MKKALHMASMYKSWRMFIALYAYVCIATQVMAVEWQYARVPLFWASGVEPNVMLFLDDSQSMENMAYSQSYSDYLANPNRDQRRYGDRWFSCTKYDYANQTCTDTDRFGMNVSSDIGSDLMVSNSQPGIRCDIETGEVSKDGKGLLLVNSQQPDIRPNPGSSNIPTVTSSGHRVVNACVLLGRANTAVFGSKMMSTAQGYPVGSNHDKRTEYDDKYLSFLLNQYFTSGSVDQLRCCPLQQGAKASNKLTFDATKSQMVPKYNRMQAVRMASKAVIDSNKSHAKIGLGRLNYKDDKALGYISVECAEGARAHLEDLTRHIDRVIAPTGDTPLAKGLDAVHHYYAGSDSPIEYRCGKNYAIVLTDGAPTRDYIDKSHDVDGATDAIYHDNGFWDDIAEKGFKSDFKSTGVDAAGVSWNDTSKSGIHRKQNLITFTIGFGEDNDLLRMTPLVNRVKVPSDDIKVVANPLLPFGSIRIASHGLQSGDALLYETLKKTGSSVEKKTTGLLQIKGGDLPSHLADAVEKTKGLYYAIRLDADHIALAETEAGAKARLPKGIPITGAGSGVHEFSIGPGKSYVATSAAELADVLSDAFTSINAANLSVASLAANSAKLDAGSRIFQVRFNTADWSGSVVAYRAGKGATLDVAAPVWVADRSVPGAMFTWNPDAGKRGGGVEFKWGSLSQFQQTALHDVNALNWFVKGDVPGLRTRANGLLGDTLNSSPVYVAQADEGYGDLPGQEGASYPDFLQFKMGRKPMLYFGSNGGMLHGLDVSTSGDDDVGRGKEVFAFVPNAAYSDFKDSNDNGMMDTAEEQKSKVDKLFQLSQPDYGKPNNPHLYFVDGSPAAGDFYSGGWKTALVGGFRFGGRGAYALDVTDTKFTGKDVMWEVNKDDNSVDNNPGNNSMGYIYGMPLMGRMANGEWAAIVPNGYDSGGDRAQLFIISLRDGHIIQQIDTKAGSPNNPNGMSSVQVKLGGDDGKTVQAIYAADLHGNVWKFDVSDASARNWKVAYESALSPRPLFTAADASGGSRKLQPITGGIAIKEHNGGTMVFVGTGKYFEENDNRYPPAKAGEPSVHTLYGLWDNGTPIDSGSDLVEQTMNATMKGTGVNAETIYRTGSRNPVDYSRQRGWYMKLQVGNVRQGERIVSQPVVNGTRLVVVSLISKNADPCVGGGRSALIEIDALTGGQLNKPVFDTNGDGKIDSQDALVLGLEADTILSAPSILERTGSSGEKEEVKVMGSSSHTAPVFVVQESVERRSVLRKGRRSWQPIL